MRERCLDKELRIVGKERGEYDRFSQPDDVIYLQSVDVGRQIFARGEVFAGHGVVELELGLENEHFEFC